MVVDKKGLKYVRYDMDGVEEQLLNLTQDPFETTHFTNDEKFKSELERLKHIYKTEWFQ